jgi:hypothetical protein
MTEGKAFSIEQSEELIAKLKTETSSEFEQLRKTLQLLGQVPDLSLGMVPPMLPSVANQTVVSIARKSSKSHRTVFTSMFAAGILVSATLTAAAVTGRGPAPIVAVAHSTAKFMKDVVGTVTSVVSGNNSGKVKDSHNENSPSAIPSGASPSSEENNSDGNNNSEASNPPVAVPQENSTKDHSGSDEPKGEKSPSKTPTRENGNSEQNSSDNKPSETPKPETSPTAQGEVVLQTDIPTPAPEISTPEVNSESPGTD